MTTTNGTATGGRLSVPALLAKLIVLAQTHGLPDPIKMDANTASGAQVDVDGRAALDMWINAMGCDGEEILETQYDDGRYGYWIYVRDWAGTGWWMQIRGIVPDPTPASPSPIDADTVTALETVAAGPKPIVSDETIEQAKRIGERYPDGVTYVEPCDDCESNGVNCTAHRRVVAP